MVAPYRRRLAAFCVDALAGAFPLLVTAPVAALFWGAGDDGRFAALMIVQTNIVLSVALYQVAQVVQLTRNRPTPGRRLLGLRVRHGDDRVRLPRAIARQGASALWLAGCALSGLYPLALVPALWALADRHGRALPDALAGLRVERVTPPTRTGADDDASGPRAALYDSGAPAADPSQAATTTQQRP